MVTNSFFVISFSPTLCSRFKVGTVVLDIILEQKMLYFIQVFKIRFVKYMFVPKPFIFFGPCIVYP